MKYLPLIVALIVLVGLTIYNRSMYELAPLEVEGTTDPSGLWTLKHDLNCTGGVGEDNNGMYSSNRAPGGFCNTGAFVRDTQMYSIKDGIGGSLLTK